MLPNQPYKSASHQTMHTWLKEDARKCRGKVVVDLGAGKMKNRPLFPGMRYIAIDLNKNALDKGSVDFPEAETRVQSVGEFVANTPVDVAVSTLVFEHEQFPAEEIVTTLRHIINQIAPGGTFLFNLGPHNLVYEAEIDALLQANFERREKRYYGRLHRLILPFPGLIGALMARLDTANVPRDPTQRRAYYACWNRRAG